jgi:heme/copper-type cytochrome/quinol oxidase subunit 2
MALHVFAIIAAAVFVVMMIAVVRHRPSGPPESSRQSSALEEYLFALIPWLIMAASALPSLRRIAAGG